MWESLIYLGITFICGFLGGWWLIKVTDWTDKGDEYLENIGKAYSDTIESNIPSDVGRVAIALAIVYSTKIVAFVFGSIFLITTFYKWFGMALEGLS